MIEFRHHDGRILRIEVGDIPVDRWGGIPYSNYAIRAESDGYGHIRTILIAEEGEVDWEEDDD